MPFPAVVQKVETYAAVAPQHADDLGICLLCNEACHESEYRRALTCTFSNCPGTQFHEDCMSTYLRKLKKPTDKMMGFPCPAVLSNGKACAGIIVVTHFKVPVNQQKKQKRVLTAAQAMQRLKEDDAKKREAHVAEKKKQAEKPAADKVLAQIRMANAAKAAGRPDPVVKQRIVAQALAAPDHAQLRAAAMALKAEIQGGGRVPGVQLADAASMLVKEVKPVEVPGFKVMVKQQPNKTIFNAEDEDFPAIPGMEYVVATKGKALKACVSPGPAFVSPPTPVPKAAAPVHSPYTIVQDTFAGGSSGGSNSSFSSPHFPDTLDDAIDSGIGSEAGLEEDVYGGHVNEQGLAGNVVHEGDAIEWDEHVEEGMYVDGEFYTLKQLYGLPVQKQAAIFGMTEDDVLATLAAAGLPVPATGTADSQLPSAAWGNSIHGTQTLQQNGHNDHNNVFSTYTPSVMGPGQDWSAGVDSSHFVKDSINGYDHATAVAAAAAEAVLPSDSSMYGTNVVQPVCTNVVLHQVPAQAVPYAGWATAPVQPVTVPAGQAMGGQAVAGNWGATYYVVDAAQAVAYGMVPMPQQQQQMYVQHAPATMPQLVPANPGTFAMYSAPHAAPGYPAAGSHVPAAAPAALAHNGSAAAAAGGGEDDDVDLDQLLALCTMGDA